MVRQHTRTKVLEKLIESLQNADKGSRELDIIVSFVLGDTFSDAGKMIHLLVEEGYPWDVISELVDEDLAPYSTSLDAALPEENIVMTLYSPRRSKWAAVHRTPAEDHVVVWAANECLARRAAALKALRPDLRRPENTDQAAPTATATKPPAARATAAREDPARRGQATRHGAADELAQDAEGEWKILF